MVKTSKTVDVTVNVSFSSRSEDGYGLLTLREGIKTWGRVFVADRLRELAEDIEDKAESEEQDDV